MKTIFIIFLGIFFIVTIQAQDRFWTQVNDAKISHLEKLERGSIVLKHQVFALDFEALKNNLNTAVSRESGMESELIIDFPDANGELQRYKIYEAPVMHPELSAKHPDIKSYIGIGLDDRTATIRFSTTIFGFHGMISSGKTQTTYIDPYTKDLNYYTVYFKNDVEKSNNNFKCLVKSENDIESSGTHFSPFGSQETQLNGSLRKFRLALACTIEYASFHVNAAGLGSGTVSQKKAVVLAAMNVSVTRINTVYERDLSVTLELVPNNESIIFITSDNFNNNNAGVLIDQSQSVITSTIGSANFDIGHTVSTGGGGLAGLGVVCKNSQKAQGITGSPSPVGDPFDIDYVTHEMGHQFGANHTFNNSCGWNWNPSTAAETGSGSTVMAYAGICPPNVQNNSSAYFHTISLNEIKNYLTNTATCSQNINNGNTKPVITAIPNKTIPKGTAFVLRGNATDVDSDALTYCWEQIDVQNSTQPPSKNSTSGPNFRSLPPSDSQNRYMPALSSVLAGNLSPTWEVVPNVGRNMKFALTVRDNNPNGGEFAKKDVTITVSGTAGPFKVTSQNNNTNWQKNTQQTITWDVAGTTNAPINVSNVNILLSTNGGSSFDYVLASNTPNDGTETITVPNVTTANARIMVEAVNNIFYAVNSSPLSIGSCFTYSNNTSVAIPDGVGTNSPGPELVSTITVSEDFTLNKVKVVVNVNHTYVNDLRILLEHPNGNIISLWNRNCTSQSGINVTFDQDFPAISCTGSTIAGIYRPVGNLNTLNGLTSQGEWKLKITDHYNQYTGTLVSWSLDLGCDTSSINDINLSDFNLYPNPNNGSFSVEFNSKNSDDIHISVFDSRGRKVFDQSYSNNGNFSQNIDLEDVQPGVYLVVIKDGENSQTRKIAVK